MWFLLVGQEYAYVVCPESSAGILCTSHFKIRDLPGMIKSVSSTFV